MEFKPIDSVDGASEVYPIMHELRTDLNREEYLSRLQAAQKESGYRLIGAYDRGECVGLIGYRILTDFVHGRHLYVDDLVVTGARRSQGLGAKMLAYAKELAAHEGCKRLRLCTGAENQEGRKFYERNGWDLRAVVFKSKIELPQQSPVCG